MMIVSGLIDDVTPWATLPFELCTNRIRAVIVCPWYEAVMVLAQLASLFGLPSTADLIWKGWKGEMSPSRPDWKRKQRWGVFAVLTLAWHLYWEQRSCCVRGREGIEETSGMDETHQSSPTTTADYSLLVRFNSSARASSDGWVILSCESVRSLEERRSDNQSCGQNGGDGDLREHFFAGEERLVDEICCWLFEGWFKVPKRGWKLGWVVKNAGNQPSLVPFYTPGCHSVPAPALSGLATDLDYD